MEERKTDERPADLRENNESKSEAPMSANGPSETQENAPKEGKLKRWWNRHKPTKRRLIQVYAALLYNANIKGFVTGEIYTGTTKYLCVPGLNCYSCPGAVGACPLGALQNALAATNTRAPYYVLGILILFGLIFARTVCGFLCPVGLGQELLYKIKTPKLKKSKITYILSYFKYVLLAALVVAVPLMYSEQLAIPGFCKYICPAGTFGGAIGLLINPANDALYGMLGGLFTWKFVVLVLVMAACMFIFRFFCRFLCPLGAIYGFFNRIALLGIKLDQNKCTECGLCVSFCKMDIRKVGDHECINCGECINVCPAKAISWKGSKLFVHPSAADVPVAEKPLTGMLHPAEDAPGKASERASGQSPEMVSGQSPEMVSGQSPEMVSGQNPERAFEQNAKAIQIENGQPMSEGKPQKTHKNAAFFLRVGACVLAGAVLVGAFVYFNTDGIASATARSADFLIEVASLDGKAGVLQFSVEDGGARDLVIPTGGTGTREDPFLLDRFAGDYAVVVRADAAVYFLYTARQEREYTVVAEDVRMTVYYRADGTDTPYFDLQSGNTVTLTPTPQGGVVHGNQVGDLLYDFTVDLYGAGGTFTLSEHRGGIVIVNFWYTTCGPCVREMPYFDEIAREYEGSVTVVAIHSAMITTQPATREGVQTWLDSTTFIGKNYPWSSSPILFAQDSGRSPTDSAVYRLLGGRGPYPMTLIVDGEGIVRYRPPRAVTYEELKATLDAILSE